MFDKSQILQALSQLLFGMLGATIVQLVFIHHVQKIVTVDITGILKSFEREALNQKLNADDLSTKVRKFGSVLNNTMEAYSSDNNFILVPKEVVTSGAIDKTEDVKELIKRRLNS
jgi:uncharacterized membrane protein